MFTRDDRQTHFSEPMFICLSHPWIFLFLRLPRVAPGCKRFVIHGLDDFLVPQSAFKNPLFFWFFFLERPQGFPPSVSKAPQPTTAVSPPLAGALFHPSVFFFRPPLPIPPFSHESFFVSVTCQPGFLPCVLVVFSPPRGAAWRDVVTLETFPRLLFQISRMPRLVFSCLTPLFFPSD